MSNCVLNLRYFLDQLLTSMSVFVSLSSVTLSISIFLKILEVNHYYFH